MCSWFILTPWVSDVCVCVCVCVCVREREREREREKGRIYSTDYATCSVGGNRNMACQ